MTRAPRQRFALVLEPVAGVDGWRALRRLLHYALRACGPERAAAS